LNVNQNDDTPDCNNAVAQALDCGLVGERGNVADALFAVADGIDGLRRSVDRLGLGGAATPMGAIEVLSMAIDEGLKALAASVGDRELVGAL
jgi:hypothetical protein